MPKKKKMQDYERKSVFDVIEKINSQYFLPDIQRNFVWKAEQIYALFDSILRDYPISTMLFWKQQGKYLQDETIKKLELVKTSDGVNIENTSIDPNKEYFLILDGQQRLTAFHIVLKGNYIIRNKPNDLYFDILSGKEEQEEGILYKFKFFPSERGNHFKTQNEDDNSTSLWYRVKDIYTINVGNLFTEVSNVSAEIKKAYDIDLSDEQKNSVSRLCSYLKTEKILYYYPEVEQDYDKVLDIFVRTNSGGTKLTHSDLLFSTIKSSWKEARENFTSLLDEINRDSFSFNTDFILKTALVILADNVNGVQYKVKNFNISKIKLIQDEWDKIKNSVLLAIDLIEDKLFITSSKVLTSNNALIPIIFWIYKNNFKGFGSEKNCIDDVNIANIGKWLMTALLIGTFGGQSDQILYKCKEGIAQASGVNFPAEDIVEKINKETKKNMNISWDFLDKVKYNSADSYLVLSMLYRGSINFSPRLKGNLPEQDHIFSRDELKKAGVPEEKINSIYNIRFIGSAENKIKTNTPYTEWVKIISKQDKEKHFLPDGEWAVNNFDKFLLQRKENINRVLTNI